MGIYLHLIVNPTTITPEDWEKSYQQTLNLFTKFPLPLLGVH